MPEKLLPEHIDPFRYAEQGLHLSGYANVVDMQRLRLLLDDHQERITVDFEFGVDKQGITYLKGHLKARLSLQCQRCMEPYIYEIISDFILGIVNTDDEANALPESYGPVLTKEGYLALRDLIEDEVILNLPIIPKHEADECKLKMPLADAEWQEKKEGNPFKVLESLKVKRDKS